MKKAVKITSAICPICGAKDNIVGYGFNRSGTQRCRCNVCKKIFTDNPKRHAYPDEIKKQAIKIYYSGVSGRGVGKIFGMGKENVVRWIKKTGNSVDKSED